MKKFLSIFLIFCATFAYADETPVFEEIGEESVEASLPLPSLNRDKKENSFFRTSFTSWSRYKANFGMEKIYLRFPQRPTINQSASLLTAYAYDYSVMYSVTGYYPPIGNIDPVRWFDEVLYSYQQYPYNIVNHTIFQYSCGDWVMDYIAYDYVQNIEIKARAIVTPFNAYTLQCVKPRGVRDYFDYFVDNFYLKCDCDY